MSTTKKEDAKPAGNKLVLEFAQTELSGRLLQIVVSSLDKLKTPWAHTSEKNQEIALNAMRQQIDQAVVQCVMVINSERKPRLNATVESVTFKDGIKATLTLDKNTDGRHSLADAAGSTICIILANPEQFTKGGEKVKPAPDQKQLGLPGDKKDADDKQLEGYEIVPPGSGFKFRVLKDKVPIPNAPKGFDTHAEAEKWLQEHLGLNKKDDKKPDAPAADKLATGAPAADAGKPADPPPVDTTLKDAIAAFTKAGGDEAVKNPADWDGAWAAVTAKFPAEFIDEHYDALSKAFGDGWEAAGK